MRILICGGRDLNDGNLVSEYIEEMTENCVLKVVIIHGGAKGVDSLAGMAAKKNGFAVDVYEADWNKYGRAAGPIRNQQMLDEGNPSEVLAFWNGESRGTLDMITRAIKHGKLVTVVPYKKD